MAASIVNQRKNFDDLKRSLSVYQKTLHEPEDTKLGADHPGNEVATIFYAQYRKSTWYYHFPERLNVVGSETGFIYHASRHPHGLLYTDLCQQLPTVICNEGYEARWTHNVGSNVMEVGQFVLNDIPLQTIDQVYKDLHGQSMIDEKDREIRSINIGNLSMLQEWNSSLPNYTTSYNIPWFYATDLTTYFPLYFCGFLDRVEHRLHLRRNVSDLLKIRRVSDGKRVPLDVTSIRSIDGKVPTGEQLKLKPPEMWGEYLYLHDIECSHNICTTTPTLKFGDYRNIMYIEDALSFDDPNPVTLGSTVSVKCENSGYPIHTIGWVAQNETAKADGDYSNYSTNSYDCHHGWSPIHESSINTGKGFIFERLPSYRTERVNTLRHFPCVPKEPGYNLWSLGAKARDFNPKPGAVFVNGSVTVRLADGNPLVGIRTGETPSRDLFSVKVRMMYTKRIVFTDFPKDEAERNRKGIIFELQGSV